MSLTRIYAPSHLASSKVKALAQGLQNIQMLDDEYSAAKLGTPAAELRQKGYQSMQLEQRLRQSSLIGSIGIQLRQVAWIWCPIMLWALYQSWQLDGAWPVEPVVLLGIFLLWFAWSQIPSVLYRHVVDACAWFRWDEADRWLRVLELWVRWFKVPLPRHELLFRRAAVQAGRGQLAQALATVAPLAQDQSLSPGMYQGRLASVYMIAKDFEQAEAVQYANWRIQQTPTTTLDLAVTRIRRLGDSAGARELLDGVDPQPLPPLVQSFYHWGQGLLSWDDGDGPGAIQHFTRALDLGYSAVGPGLGMEGILADVHAYCGLALASQGELKAAKSHFQIAVPMLKARNEHELLARCKAAYRKLADRR